MLTFTKNSVWLSFFFCKIVTVSETAEKKILLCNIQTKSNHAANVIKIHLFFFPHKELYIYIHMQQSYRDIFYYRYKIRCLCNYHILQSQQIYTPFIFSDEHACAFRTLCSIPFLKICLITIITGTGICGTMHIK